MLNNLVHIFKTYLQTFQSIKITDLNVFLIGFLIWAIIFILIFCSGCYYPAYFL